MSALKPATQAPPKLRIWVDDPDGIPTRVEVRRCAHCAALVEVAAARKHYEWHQTLTTRRS